MKPGYKQTEVGVIPEDWEVTVIGDKADKVGSGTTPTGGKRVYRSEGRPFMRSQNYYFALTYSNIPADSLRKHVKLRRVQYPSQ